MRKALLLFILLLVACSEPPAPVGYKIGRDRSFYPLSLMGKERYLVGYTDELDLSLWLRKARPLRDAWGTPSQCRAAVLESSSAADA